MAPTTPHCTGGQSQGCTSRPSAPGASTPSPTTQEPGSVGGSAPEGPAIYGYLCLCILLCTRKATAEVLPCSRLTRALPCSAPKGHHLWVAFREGSFSGFACAFSDSRTRPILRAQGTSRERRVASSLISSGSLPAWPLIPSADSLRVLRKLL